MKNKLFGMASQWGAKAGDALSTAAVNAAALLHDHKPDAQEMAHAKDKIHKMAAATVVEVKDALKSDLAKDAAKGAAIGVVVGVPVPVIGPAFGAVVGAGLGAYAHLTRAKAEAPPPAASDEVRAGPAPAPSDDMYTQLLRLDDLLKRGILTQEEFDAQKAKVLNDY